jgi:hypothetical protein
MGRPRGSEKKGCDENNTVVGGGGRSEARLFPVYLFNVQVSFLFCLQGVGKSMLCAGRNALLTFDYIFMLATKFIHVFDLDLSIRF